MAGQEFDFDINCSISSSIITLDSKDAESAGTISLYYKEGSIYLDGKYTNLMTSTENPITIPTKTGYTFDGYYVEVEDTELEVINDEGYITDNLMDVIDIDEINIYAKWVQVTPICVINGNPTDWTSGSVTLTVVGDTNNESLASLPYSWTSDSTDFGITSAKTIDTNGTYTAYIMNASGDVGSCSSTVTKIDNTAPTIPELTTIYDIWGSETYSVSGYSSDVGIDGTWTTISDDPIMSFSDLKHISGIYGAYIELEEAIADDIVIQMLYATSSTYYSSSYVTANTLYAGEKK